MNTDEAFQILELPTTASLEEVKETYKLLSIVWHPDRFKPGSEASRKAEEKLKKINLAYSVLIAAFKSGDFNQADKAEKRAKAKKQEGQVSTFEATYLGDDPRVSLKKGKCKLAIHPDFIGMMFNSDEIVAYQAETIAAVKAHGKVYKTQRLLAKSLSIPNDLDSNVLLMCFEDPEEIVDYFKVKIEINNNYFSKLAIKRICDSYDLIPHSITPNQEPPKKKQSPQQTTSAARNNPENQTPEPNFAVPAFIVFSFFLVLIFMLLFASFSKHSDNYAGAGYLAPQNAKIFTKGSFTAWTIPNDPAPGKDYKIIFMVKIPSHATRYRASDLSGIVIGTDGYRQPIPGPEYKRGSVYLPIKDGHAELEINVPGAASRVRDSIEIRSTILKEKQLLEIEF